MSLLEAMSFGITCVVSDIDANKELIKHGKNGLIFSLKKGHVDLSNKLSLLLNYPELKTSLGKQSLMSIKKIYSANASLNKCSMTYAEIHKFRGN